MSCNINTEINVPVELTCKLSNVSKEYM